MDPVQIKQSIQFFRILLEDNSWSLVSKSPNVDMKLIRNGIWAGLFLEIKTARKLKPKPNEMPMSLYWSGLQSFQNELNFDATAQSHEEKRTTTNLLFFNDLQNEQLRYILKPSFASTYFTLETSTKQKRTFSMIFTFAIRKKILSDEEEETERRKTAEIDRKLFVTMVIGLPSYIFNHCYTFQMLLRYFFFFFGSCVLSSVFWLLLLHLCPINMLRALDIFTFSFSFSFLLLLFFHPIQMYFLFSVVNPLCAERTKKKKRR